MTDASEALESIRDELDLDDDAAVIDAVEALKNHAQELRAEKRTSMKNIITDQSEYTHDELADHTIEELEWVIDGLNHALDEETDEEESTLKTATNDVADESSSTSSVRGKERVDPRAFQ